MAFYLVLIILTISVILPGAAANTLEPMITDRVNEKPVPLLVFFDDVSETVTIASANNSDYGVRSSIRKSDVIAVNVKRLKGLIESGQHVRVHLNGIPYSMILQKNQIHPETNSGTETFAGHLESIPDGKIQDYIIHLTITDTKIEGSFYRHGVQTILISSSERENPLDPDMKYHYIYDDREVVRTLVDMNTGAITTSPTTQKSPLAGIISICAAGIGAACISYYRRK